MVALASEPVVDAAQEAQALEPTLQEGLATWYGGKKWHGRRTASGERFDRYSFTAAHRTLPLGTIVRVVNQHNGRMVHVRINDRGPYAKNRIIDLSEAAADQLDMIRAGRALVSVHPKQSAK
jgi:rare lipoprotein A